MKTAHLTGPALNWAVDRLEGGRAPTNPEHLRSYLLSLDEGERWNKLCKYTPGDIRADTMSHADMIEYGLITWRCPPVSTDWSFGGPIIEREGLCLSYDAFVKRWNCATPVLDSYQAETPLVAAMRCYVASELGDEVEIPQHFLETTA
jgi:Protein of unknown function (DUF2591)